MASAHDGPPPGGRLLPTFFTDELRRSGLTPDDVPHWRAIMGPSGIARELGQPDDEHLFAGAGMAIPYLDLSGQPILDQGLHYSRVRMMDPLMAENGKYRSPVNSSPHLYIPTGLSDLVPYDPEGFRMACPLLIITEGEKKAEALVKIGLPAVALAGVWMWAEPMTDEEKIKKSPKRLIQELGDLIVEFMPSRVLVMFDSDGKPDVQNFFKVNRIPKYAKLPGKTARYAANPQVWQAAQDLVAALMGVFKVPTAATFTPWLESHGGAKGSSKLDKCGIDDFIMNAADRSGVGVQRGRVPPAVEVWLSDQREMLLDTLTQDDIDRAVVARTRAESGVGGADAGGYIPLGLSGDHAVVVWNKESQKIVTIQQPKITNAATLMALAGGDFVLNNPAWQTSDSEDGKRGIDIIVAAAEIFRACAELGPFYRDRAVRGAGVWADPEDPDSLIVNASNGVFRISSEGDPVEIPRCEPKRMYVYPRAVVAPLVMTYEEQEDVAQNYESEDSNRDIVALVRRWNYRREIDGMMLAGWWCSTAFLGVLAARPGAFVTGESASGKTALFNRLSALMTSYKHHIELGSDSSQPGIRQLLGRDALPLILDELEPGNSTTAAGRKRGETVEGLFRMLRASYSASGGDRHGVIKGSASGEAVDFSIRTAGLVGGVNVAQLDQADRNRLIIVELIPPREGVELPDMLSDAEMEMQGHFLRNVLWRYWRHFRRNLPVVVKRIKEQIGRADGRVALTYGIPICAMATYGAASKGLTDDDMVDADMEKAANVLIPHVREHFIRTAGGGGTDQANALELLMSASVVVEHNIIVDESMRSSRVTRTVSDIVESACREYALSNFSYSQHNSYSYALALRGMTVRIDPDSKKRWLFYCFGEHTERRRLENALGYSGLGKILERLDGVLRSDSHIARIEGLPAQITVAGSKRRGLWIPLSTPESDMKAEQEGPARVGPAARQAT
ncbi:DUF3854 domain-containing protein [Acidiphilium sp.]|uniref:DUF3854 domain-containing protein n=1 Tax=Acidiphilium sp. TaxID=527 RepID=UPI003CFDE2E8